MATDYVPHSEAQLVPWLANFVKKINTHGFALGLTAEEMTSIRSACIEISSKIAGIEQKRTELQDLIEIKDNVKNLTLAAIRCFVTRMKMHPAFTDEIGQDLKIIATNGFITDHGNKITLKAGVSSGRVRIDFTKKHFTAVNIYARLHGTEPWTFLARDTTSPYEDNRPLLDGQPEWREYMGLGVIGDNEVGRPSDIVGVIVKR